jgi:DNA-binding NarL/FixJ family response regulator
MTKPIRILIADDHSVVRFGLATLLERRKDFQVVGEAKDGEVAVAMAKSTNPDVVIMDLMMPHVDGAEATRLICEANPEIKVLILTSYATSADIVRAIDAGASGAIVKDADNAELIDAIMKVAAGETAFSGEISRAIETEPMTREFTQKQLDVLHSITRGLSNPDIATQLGISLNAVKQHIRAVFTKLGASNRTEAVAIALRKHLLKL